MRKLTLPILVSLMVLALVGIIIIQYQWINKTVTEKQNLIDQKVHQAVANVDEKLSDYNTMAFLSLADQGHNAYTHLDSHTVGPHIQHFNIFSDHDEEDVDCTSSANIRVSFLSEADTLLDQGVEVIHGIADCVGTKVGRHLNFERNFEFDGLEDLTGLTDMKVDFDGEEAVLMMVDRVHNLFEKVEIELDDVFGSGRMDSAKIAGFMNEEFEAMGLDAPQAWAVYDKKEQKQIVLPKEQMEWDFTIPLNKNDVIHPNRFQLQMNIDKSELLWSDIRTMVILSLLFLLIMLIVFIYAVRLVIKHKKISQIKSDFINNMTHEFKTPLASISLAADSVVHPNVRGNWDQVEKYVEIIQTEKSKLNDQVERILEVASLQKGSLEIPTEPIRINDVVKSSTEKLGLLLQENEVELTIKEEDDATIAGNEFYLERVFTNIIENSIKYSKDKPVIDISIARKNDLIEVEIADQGIGMSKKQIDKVFDNFYRVQSGNVHDTKGFGLGLSYAKLITEKLKGTISMDGKPDVGCTVKLQFPIAA